MLLHVMCWCVLSVCVCVTLLYACVFVVCVWRMRREEEEKTIPHIKMRLKTQTEILPQNFFSSFPTKFSRWGQDTPSHAYPSKFRKYLLPHKKMEWIFRCFILPKCLFWIYKRMIFTMSFQCKIKFCWRWNSMTKFNFWLKEIPWQFFFENKIKSKCEWQIHGAQIGTCVFRFVAFKIWLKGQPGQSAVESGP